MIDLRKNIIIVEGLDCSGKTDIARMLAKEYELDFIDNEFLREHFQDFRGQEWAWMVDGINLQQAQFVKSTSGFVKTRYSLTEMVYREYYQRKGVINPVQMELAGNNKLILLYIDLNYDKYRSLRREFRKNEKEFTEAEFNKQRGLFTRAYNDTIIRNKAKVLNNSSFCELSRKACFAVEKIAIDAGNNRSTIR